MVAQMSRLRKFAFLSVAVAILAAGAFAVPMVLPAGPSPASAAGTEGGETEARGTGLPLPRFVSLKSGNVNVRRGPGQDYDVLFRFVRAGLPVEIIQEFDNWRKIRDSEGEEGWIFHSLLSGERTALVAPWEQDGQFAAHQRAGADAAVVAWLEPRVVTDVEECTGAWCLVKVSGIEGWIEQDRLWGVYPEETFD
jgi:SH3-like domain-containing protein